MSDNIKTIKEYFELGTFVIPNYQRGYKWGVPDKDGNCAVSVLCKNIIDAFIRRDEEYFIEAVTVVEKNKEIILVDGQQRTTTLYLLFISLGYFDELKGVKLKYLVRADSDLFLKKLLEKKGEITDKPDTQDAFYFIKAIEKIKELFKLKTVNEIDAFRNFLLEKVKLIYNVIDEKKAITTFTALNGLKAVMKDEELIKSDLLIKSARPPKQNIHTSDEAKLGIEWKINEDRSRIAHNWDKWLYWWNRPEVKEYYGTGNKHPLYFLLITYWKINKEDETAKDFTFENFKTKFIGDSVKAKNSFDGLRKLQKTFEDYYNTPEVYNYLGIILKTSNSKEDALMYFLRNKKEPSCFKEYSKWALVGATHLEIIKNTTEKQDDQEILIKNKKAQDAIDLVDAQYVYWDENGAEYNDNRKEYAFRFLMWLNLVEDNKLKRNFDFTIWSNRSLEHIHPKSKTGELTFVNDTSIHCIGNLVLLYGKNNSTFGAKDFEEKKRVYFNTGSELKFESRNLLHTLSVFASSKWGVEEIVENKQKVIKMLGDIYAGK